MQAGSLASIFKGASKYLTALNCSLIAKLNQVVISRLRAALNFTIVIYLFIHLSILHTILRGKTHNKNLR